MRRAQLIDAAHQVFVEHGFHGASMDEIAETAQVSKPVLYQHFSGKKDLYLALLDHHLETLTQLLVTALGSTTVNEHRVSAAVAVYFEFMDSEKQAYRLIFESDVANFPAVAERLEALHSRFAEEIAEIIMQDALLPKPHAELLARGLAGLAQVSARAWVAQGEDERVPVETAIRLVTDLAWRGISLFRVEPH